MLVRRFSTAAARSLQGSQPKDQAAASAFVQGETGFARPLSLPKSKLPIASAAQAKKSKADAPPAESPQERKVKRIEYALGVVEQLVPYQPVNANARDTEKAQKALVATTFKVDQSTKVLIARLYKSDPVAWDLRSLSRKFNLPVRQITNILYSFTKPKTASGFVPEDFDHYMQLGAFISGDLLNIAKGYKALDIAPSVSLEQAAARQPQTVPSSVMADFEKHMADETMQQETRRLQELATLRKHSGAEFSSESQIQTSAVAEIPLAALPFPAPTSPSLKLSFVAEFLLNRQIACRETELREETMDLFDVDFAAQPAGRVDPVSSTRWPEDEAFIDASLGSERTVQALSVLLEASAIAKRRFWAARYGTPMDPAAYIPEQIGTLPPGADGRNIVFKSYPKLALVDDAQFFQIIKEIETRDTRVAFGNGMDYNHPRNRVLKTLEKRDFLGKHHSMIALVDKSKGKTISSREMRIVRPDGSLTEPSANERYVLDHMVFARPFKKLRDALPVKLPHPDEIRVA